MVVMLDVGTLDDFLLLKIPQILWLKSQSVVGQVPKSSNLVLNVLLKSALFVGKHPSNSHMKFGMVLIAD